MKTPSDSFSRFPLQALAWLASVAATISTLPASPLSGPPALLNANATSDSGFDGAVRMASDGLGGIVAVWTSSENLAGAGADQDIFVARSSDGGQSWSGPEALNTNAASDSGNDSLPVIAADRDGHLVTVWQSTEDLGGAGTDPDVFVARSSDGGMSWSAPALLDSNATSNGGFSFKEPTIATDGVGTWIACWTSTYGSGGDQDIHFSVSQDDGANWSAAAPLNGDALTDEASDFNPAIHANSHGLWVAAWAHENGDGGSNLQVAHSTDGGASWSAPRGLHAQPIVDGGLDFQPNVHVNEQGHAMVVWESGADVGGSGDDQDILYALLDSGGWSSPAAVNADAGEGYALDSSPAVTADDCGHWLVVWATEKAHYPELGEDSDILAAHFEYGTSGWSTPLPVAAEADRDTGEDTSPAIVLGPDGRGVVAWSSRDDFAGSGSDGDLQFVGIPRAVFWGSTGVLNRNASSDGPNEHDRMVEAAGDGRGTLVSVWQSSGGAAGTDGDIFFARSDDGGETWSVPALLNTNGNADTGFDTDPSVVHLSGSEWLAIWTSNEDLGGAGNDQDLLCARSVDGGLSWSAPAPLSPNATSDTGISDFDATMAADGQQVVVVWSTDLYGVDQDIAFSRSSDGGRSWTAPAPMNPGAAGDDDAEFDPTVAAGGNGTWIASWFSNNPTGGIGSSLDSDDDLIFRRSTDGGATWSSGRALNTNAGGDNIEADDMRPSLASDGQGNWVAVWHLEGHSFEETPGDEADTLMARSSDDGQSWTAPKALHVRRDETVNEGWPRVATTGDGLWAVAWPALDYVVGEREPGEGSNQDLEILWVTSADNGATWSVPAALNRNAPDDSGRDDCVALVKGSRSQLLAVWSSNENVLGVAGTDYDIFYARLDNPDAYRRWLNRQLGYDRLDPANEATIWGEEADYDRDGNATLMEYFAGLDLVVRDSPDRPILQCTGPGSLEIRYRKSKDATLAAEADVEWSEDCLTWKPSGERRSDGSVVIITDEAPVDHGSWEEARASIDSGSAHRLFVRVVVRRK